MKMTKKQIYRIFSVISFVFSLLCLGILAYLLLIIPASGTRDTLISLPLYAILFLALSQACISLMLYYKR